MLTVSDTLPCYYCAHRINTQADDWQRIGKGVYAHDVCAWRVNDEFWAVREPVPRETSAHDAV